VRPAPALLVVLAAGAMAIVETPCGTVWAQDAPGPQGARGARATCETICEGAAAPECPRCEPANVCSDLYQRDRAAYDACVARANSCFERAHDCAEGSSAGWAARADCSGDAACCAAACAGDLSPPHESTRAWLYADLLGALQLRLAGDNVRASFAGGAELELLVGKPTWHGDSVPARAGPFASFVIDHRGAIDAALGLSVLFWARHLANDPGFAKGILLSAGAVLDRPSGGPSAAGVLARLAFGLTGARRRTWKPVSGWVYLEVDAVPADPLRASVFVGLRLAPLSALLLLIPGAGDP
jgi:hypothetical protein